MPYDSYGNYVPSKADKTTDVFGYDAIGGVGQLIYHLVRFKEYELDYAPNNVLIARPYCQKGYEPELYTNDSPTGAELTASIFNLAKKIDDPSEERPYTDLIIEWCKKYGHPTDDSTGRAGPNGKQSGNTAGFTNEAARIVTGTGNSTAWATVSAVSATAGCKPKSN